MRRIRRRKRRGKEGEERKDNYELKGGELRSCRRKRWRWKKGRIIEREEEEEK
jgi:hypothetical protein